MSELDVADATIAGLRAEVERLRRDLANAERDRGMWERKSMQSAELVDRLRAELASVSICGDQLNGPWGNLDSDGPGPFGVLWCDLPAGHAGWHGCLVPGSPERTSWTHGEEQT